MTDDFQITPPLLGVKPPTVCGYMPDGVVCAKPATWHIIWNPEMDNGAACDEHYEASKRWAWYTSHRMNDVCREGGGYVVFLSDAGDSTCVHDEDHGDLLASIAAGIERRVDLDTGRLLPVLVPVGGDG